MKDQKALSTIKEEQAITVFNVDSLITLALTNKAPVGTIERIMAMRKQLKDEWAKEEYDKAMAGFQFECPPIRKNKSVKTNAGAVAYSYTPIEFLDAETKALREKYGFSYSSNMINFSEGGEVRIKVLLKVTQKAGHSEISEVTVPLGSKTGIMSDTQVAMAAATYAKRHAFINAFGITMVGEDDEALLKKNEKTEEPVPQQMIDSINAAKTPEDLLAVSKALADANPKLLLALRIEYARRKNEIATEFTEEVAKGLEKQEVKHE